MAPSLHIYDVLNIIGSILGALTNTLLIAAILKTSDRLRSNSYLFLVSGVLDGLFSCVEFFVQHLLVRGGVVYVMPHGIERYAPEWAYLIVMPLHLFLCQNCVLILAAQYRFRFQTIKAGETPRYLVLKYTSLCTVFSIIVGAFATASAYMGKSRGLEYYQTKLEEIDERGAYYLMYACDMDDIATKMFFWSSILFSSIATFICAYNFWKAWRFVHIRDYVVSTRTAKLQSQFTRTLVAQTANSFLLAVCPLSMIAFSMVLRLDVEFIGMGCVVPMTFLPAANAILTLYFVAAYRRYLKSLFNCHYSVNVESSTRSAQLKIFSLVS